MKRVPIVRRTPLQSRGRLRFRSPKREAEYRHRRPLVAELLAERPMCERCQQARSDDVHELLSRARGGSILDENNLACLCRFCHVFITTEPRIAAAEGWALSRRPD